jgi:hypothetical protein
MTTLKTADRWATTHFKSILEAFKTVESPSSVQDFKLKLERYLDTGEEKLAKKLDELLLESGARWADFTVPADYKDNVLNSYRELKMALRSAVADYPK